MLSNTQLTIVRTVATAVVTALATLQVLYPSYSWVAAVTAAFATLGIHAIPSIQQRGNIMTDGLTAMGLKPAVQTATVPAELVEPAVPESPEAASATEAAPATETSPVKQVLVDAANALLKVAETL